MGNQLQQMYYPTDYDTKETAEIGPFIRTPFTDITAPLIHNDLGVCRSFESNYLDCMEAYGNIQGKKECKLYFHDLLECQFHQKQLWRMQAMMQERWKQYVKGQLGLGPVCPQFADPPPMDCYGADNLEND